MAFTVQDIAAALGAEALGAADLSLTGVSEPAMAGPTDLALAMSPAYADELGKGAARAAVIGPDMDWRALGLQAAVVAPRPRYAMAYVTTALDAGPRIALGIHPSAVIDPTAKIGDGCAIGPLVVIGPEVTIGTGARIAAHVSIAEGARIGASVLFHSGARVGARVKIGDRVILNPNCVIGGDGFSFVTPEKSQVEAGRESLGKAGSADTLPQSWTRIHSLGAVILGDDVEIGACATIDRGTIMDTTIGQGTKIDSLVQVGHNCRIGADNLLCGHAGVSGSVTTGDRVVLGGKVGVSDNIMIGSDVVAAGGTNIYTNVPSGRFLMGSPAVKMDAHIEMYKVMRRLPRLAKAVTELQKAVFKPGKTP